MHWEIQVRWQPNMSQWNEADGQQTEYFKCDNCEYKYNSDTNMLIHKRSVHEPLS